MPEHAEAADGPRKLQWLIITLWTETLVLLATRGLCVRSTTGSKNSRSVSI